MRPIAEGLGQGDRGTSRRTTGALVMNLVAVLTWSVTPVMIRSVTESFSVNFMNSVRYLVSLAVLWPVLCLGPNRGTLGRDLRIIAFRFWKVALIALANYGFQIFYTYGLYLVTASVQTLVQQTQVIFGVIFAVILFADERSFVSDARFLLGALLALSGVALVILGAGTTESMAFNIGILAVLGNAFCWAALGAMIRLWLSDLPPLLSITSVFTVVTPMFILTNMATHRGLQIPSAPVGDWLVLAASGLLGAGLGQSLFYRAVPIIGVSVSTSIGLLTPFLTSLLEFALYGKTLRPAQIAGGLALLGGSFLVIRARFRRRA